MNTQGWTYGAEMEWADHPLDREPPEGYGRDTHDITIVNSNGIANDPRGKLYRFGGEFNTPPTDTIEEQVACMTRLKKHYPEARINYRSNLHLHIRMPGLGSDLVLLKRVQKYIHAAMPSALLQIQPLPRPKISQFPTEEEHRGALRRWRRQRVSHQTLLTPKRLSGQLWATSLEDFYRAEVPYTKNEPFKPLWHLQPRLCVNLRQHRETDTIEFRHFAGTMDEELLETSLRWCRDFLRCALDEQPIIHLLTDPAYRTDRFPQFQPYAHWMEKRYRATVHDGTLTKAQIAENIDKILNGEFDD